MLSSLHPLLVLTIDKVQALYETPDDIELYPGLQAEEAKTPFLPGSGLCPGFTIATAILADAVALVRGDRFYAVDYSPANLTNFGYVATMNLQGPSAYP